MSSRQSPAPRYTPGGTHLVLLADLTTGTGTAQITPVDEETTTFLIQAKADEVGFSNTLGTVAISTTFDALADGVARKNVDTHAARGPGSLKLRTAAAATSDIYVMELL